MRGLIVFIFIFNAQAQDLTEVYDGYAPFHETLYEPFPEEQCQSIRRGREKRCSLVITAKPNPEKFKQLLSETESQHGIDQNFLQTPLGRKYQKLKNFVQVYDGLDGCEPDRFTDDKLKNILARVTNNTSAAEFKAHCFLPDLSYTINDPSFFEKFNEAVLGKSHLVDLLQAENLRQSIKARDEFDTKYIDGGLPESAGLNDLNQKITSLNDLLRGYKEQKESLEQQVDNEIGSIKNTRQGSRRKQALRRSLRQRLINLKRKTFSQYQQRLATIHSDGAGDLLQTDIIREKSGIKRLETLVPQFFGLAGFENEEFLDPKLFEPLKKIEAQDYRTGVSEIMERLDHQIAEINNDYDLNESRDDDLLKKYIQVSPFAVGTILANKPELTPHICEVAKSLAREKRNEEILTQTSYIVLGSAVAIAGIATLGGTLPATAIIAGTVAAGAFTAGDFFYQRSLANRAYQRREDMLNAYLANMGDDMSISEIQSNWQQMNQADYSSKVTLGLGVFDLMGVSFAARAGAAARLTKGISRFDQSLSQNRGLLNKIASSNKYTKLTRKLLDQYPKEVVGRYFSLVAKLPSAKQAEVLEKLAAAKEIEALYPAVLAAALRAEFAGNKADIAKLDNLVEEMGINRKLDSRISEEFFFSAPLVDLALKLETEEILDLQNSIKYLQSRGLETDAIKTRIIDKLKQCRVIRSR